MNIKRMVKKTELLMSAILFILSVYELYVRLTANDEVDEAFSMLDQFDLNSIKPEVSE
ncbi:hypothetical protein [Staphylococcus sp. IVB6227]|uniref:hypothetical protein n=1 Tax=Staphylococcus sp. IVB6227 TaxID=2989768 RepID=UPI0021D11A6B|nr:hypothetical protein [Staphylococcus sp. IVB6227]UXR77644.1 hypothetical protein MUA92_07105 [Staphylococcus sp. IVB6227]